ncbi:hypothetical protein BH09BAC6_BH09BAC6_05580 [soil metagenome]
MNRVITLMFVIAIAASCKKPYAPPVIKADNNYLVVEGVIAAGGDSTNIKLSRTVKLADSVNINPEKGAKVVVQGDQNVTYPLKESVGGTYSALLNLDNTHKYRLSITSADGRTYLSDYTEVKVTPPIDTLAYSITANGINFSSNAHDPANNTRYYRWDYKETYVYITPIFTFYKFDKSRSIYTTHQSVLRTPAEYINTCYVTRNSTTILLNSSARLQQDVIVNNPIAQLSTTSDKILHRYSMLLKQYAITKGAYDFYTILKKNTEQLGSIFDAQPSQLKGNIHCTSTPAEPVLGYISACTVAQKRIFIDRSDLPAWPVPHTDCAPYVVGWYKGEGTPPEVSAFIVIPLEPIMSGYDEKKKDTTYSVHVGDYFCVDCTYHGTNKKPAFWK